MSVNNVSFKGNLIVNNARVHKFCGVYSENGKIPESLKDVYENNYKEQSGSDSTQQHTDSYLGQVMFKIPTDQIRKIFINRNNDYCIRFNSGKSNQQAAESDCDSMISFKVTDNKVNPFILYTAACQNPNVDIVV